MKNVKRNHISWIVVVMILTLFCCNTTVYAEYGDETEIDDGERAEYVEGETIENVDQYVDGIYNSNEHSRATLSGMIRLAQSGTKLAGNYSTSYTYTVDIIGVKNVKLQYKGALGLWHNIITLDNRYFTNKSSYSGSFTTTGVVGRTYRLKCTHYITNNGSTETRDNVTGNLTF